MLLIERVEERNNIKSDYVKCPVCGRGRLCDKPFKEKAKSITVASSPVNDISNKIILKCPKCSNKFFIQFSNE